MSADDDSKTPVVSRLRGRVTVPTGEAEQTTAAPDRTPLGAEIEAAFDERARLIAAGDDPAVVQNRILTMQRAAREGGQLRGDDLLGDGRYRLVRVLGAGGFATVWEAFDREEEISVAVKVLHTHFAADVPIRERFFRGARKMNELRHAAIVGVRQPHGRDGGYYFFVMDLIAGGDLSCAIRSRSLSRSGGVTAVLHAAEGVQFANEHGMVHRDISPSNIMLAEGDRGVVTDFDLVRAFDTTGGTRTGAMGKFLYSAPELHSRPQDATHSADVFSLGMTAAFCLYGDEIPRVEAYRGLQGFIDELDCNERVKVVLKQAVSWVPTDRFDSALAFKNALETALSTPDRPRFGRTAASRRSVLIVDDEKFIRDILSDFIGMEGHDTIAAEDVRSARLAVSGRSFDVALVDLKMPGGEGLELISEWHNVPGSPTPILMTGFGTIEKAVEAMRCGALDVILKPFKVEEVLALVSKAIESRRVRP